MRLYNEFKTVGVASCQTEQLRRIGEEGAEIDDGQSIYGIVRRPDNAFDMGRIAFPIVFFHRGSIGIEFGITAGNGIDPFIVRIFS